MGGPAGRSRGRAWCEFRGRVGPSRLAGAIVCLLAPRRPARAYDFSVDVRTIGQGYQVRGFAPDGSNELLTRRRLTQYLDLNVYDIEPDAWHGDDGGRNNFYVDASLRFDTDFGGYMLGRPTGPNEIRELQQNQVDILYAFVGGRNVGGRLDFQLGRQIHFDLVDFYSFDGADVLLRATRPLRRRGVRRHRGARRAAAVVADVRARRHQRRLARSGDPAGAELARSRRWRARRWSPGAPTRLVVGAALVPRDLVGDRRSPAGRADIGRQRREVVSLTATAAGATGSSSRAACATTSCSTSSTMSSSALRVQADAAPVADAGAGLSGADVRRRFDLERLLDRRLPRSARQLRDRPAAAA